MSKSVVCISIGYVSAFISTFVLVLLKLVGVLTFPWLIICSPYILFWVLFDVYVQLFMIWDFVTGYKNTETKEEGEN